MNIVINFAREIGTLMFISRVIPNLFRLFYRLVSSDCDSGREYI